MTITKKKYGILDILRIPIQCAPFYSIAAGLQDILAGIVPTIQILVTARFIDAAISVVKGTAEKGDAILPLALVVAFVMYSWVAGALLKFVQVRMELGLRRKLRTAITEKRAKLAYRYIEDHEAWDLISRVAKEPGSHAKNAYFDFFGIV